MIWIITDNTNNHNELVTVAFSEIAVGTIRDELAAFDTLVGEHHTYTVKSVVKSEINDFGCLTKEYSFDT